MTQSFYCEKYNCTMRPEACVVRQKNAVKVDNGWGAVHYSYRVGYGDPNCLKCEQGRSIAEKTDPEDVVNYKNDLKTLRLKARNRTWPKSVKQETREEKPMDTETPKEKEAEKTETQETKTCKKCGVEKPMDQFHLHTGLKDGHENRCKQCKLEGAKARREKNRAAREAGENPDPSATTKTCMKCHQEKSLKEFYLKADGLYGRDSYCRDCKRAQNKKWLERRKKKAGKDTERQPEKPKVNPKLKQAECGLPGEAQGQKPPSWGNMIDALNTQIGGDHYRDFAIQPIEFVTRNRLGFIAGCIVKRICRYNLVGGKGLEDLEKIKHEIECLIQLEGWAKVEKQSEQECAE